MDCAIRFIQMYADVVMGLDHAEFEEALEIAKEDGGFFLDTEMSAEDWQALVKEYQAIVERETGRTLSAGTAAPARAIGARLCELESDWAKVYRCLESRSPANGAPRSMCRRWCSAIRATLRRRVWRSRGDPATGERAW